MVLFYIAMMTRSSSLFEAIIEADLFHVNGLCFMGSISHKILCSTSQLLMNKEMKTIMEGLRQIVSFIIEEVLGLLKFEWIPSLMVTSTIV